MIKRSEERRALVRLDVLYLTVSVRAFRRAANAGVAQLVEQLICNQQVGGSSPSTSSLFCNQANKKCVFAVSKKKLFGVLLLSLS